MNYRYDRYGTPVSTLGFGCMRLPTHMGKIDLQLSEKLIMRAIEAGVNYFDTAYIYPGSEAALGEILARNHAREKVRIATKLPHYLIRSQGDMEKLFLEELRRLQTDYVDHYLMHMLSDVQTWEKLKAMGIEAWLQEKKESGAIRQIGFSYHGNADMFCQLVDAYDWDFCMIQYNYMDEHSQAGRKGLQYAHAKGLPVWIMEPLRGGKLVSHLPKEALRIFDEYSVKHTLAQWAFRWLWNQPEVTCVLSGMNTMDTLEENLQTASQTQAGDLTPADEEMLTQVVQAVNARMKVGCTGCGYCMPCPKNVDIPGTFSAYNRRYAEGKFWALVDYAMCTAMRKTSSAASNCIGCGKCEKHCPQGIEIRKELQKAKKELECLPYRGFRKAVELLKLF